MILISDTQLRIIDAFFLLAEKSNCAHKITMQEIAEKAGIRRQNIYKNHFNGIEDIIHAIHQIVDSNCKKMIEKFIECDFKSLSVFLADEILPILYNRRVWLKNLYKTSLDPGWIPFLYEQYRPLVKEYLKNDIDKLCSQIGVCSDFLYNYIIGHTLVIISSWITSDNPEPPSLFRYKFLNLFSLALDDVI